MELLQCVNTSGQTYKRAYHSEDRDVAVTKNSLSSSRTPRSTDVKSATLSGGERRVSLPAGQHYTSSTMGRTPTEPSKYRLYGSSLSLADETHGTHDLTSRTLRPPSPTTLRKSSTTLPPSAAMNKTERRKPSLPQMRVELESPKLADYLERPRLVSVGVTKRNEAAAAAASAHHAKRYENNGVPTYRNLRLGNFMEMQEEADGDDIIPERLRQYYLDTYLNVCNYCDASTHCTHCNPLSPIHRGM